MLKTYKYRLYPNKPQKQAIDAVLDLCRNLYNAALEHRIYSYKHHDIRINYTTQQNDLPGLKQVLPEYKTVQSQVLQDVLRRLDKAYQNFFRRVKQGEKPGFPRYQSYKRYNSFTYPQSGFTLSENHLQLSKIGNIKMKLHRPVDGIIKTCTMVEQNNNRLYQYYLKISLL